MERGLGERIRQTDRRMWKEAGAGQRCREKREWRRQRPDPRTWGTLVSGRALPRRGPEAQQRLCVSCLFWRKPLKSPERHHSRREAWRPGVLASCSGLQLSHLPTLLLLTLTLISLPAGTGPVPGSLHRCSHPTPLLCTPGPWPVHRAHLSGYSSLLWGPRTPLLLASMLPFLLDPWPGCLQPLSHIFSHLP